MRDLVAQTIKGFRDGYRYVIHEGGTRSGKTHSILTSLYHIVNSRKCIASVVSETVPHLKRGAIRDYKRILMSQDIWDDDSWNKSDYIHTIKEGKILEFFSADTPDKVHGPERDFLFINEAQNIDYEVARQLFVRTRKTVFIDFNPSREFWAHTELKNDPGTLWIHSTYKDNVYLTPEQVVEIERNKNNKTWWSIYGEGKIAESEAAIYRDWQVIDSVPHEARLERYGLDFGYTADPSSLVAVYRYNQGYILDEILYRSGLNNSQIADIIKSQPHALVVADSAEPKSIAEISLHGVSIVPTDKGKDSVNNGIQQVQAQRISVTKRSLNIIREYRNYLWMTDRDGKIINEPGAGFDHSMDAIRYAITNISHIQERTYRQPSRPRLTY